LWELWNSQAVCDFVKERIRRDLSLSQLAGELLDMACSISIKHSRGRGLDNLTCIVVDLRPGKPLLPDREDKPKFTAAADDPLSESDSDDVEIDA